MRRCRSRKGAWFECGASNTEEQGFAPVRRGVFFARPKKAPQRKAARRLAVQSFGLNGALRFSPKAGLPEGPIPVPQARARILAGTLRADPPSTVMLGSVERVLLRTPFCGAEQARTSRADFQGRKFSASGIGKSRLRGPRSDKAREGTRRAQQRGRVFCPLFVA